MFPFKSVVPILKKIYSIKCQLSLLSASAFINKEFKYEHLCCCVFCDNSLPLCFFIVTISLTKPPGVAKVLCFSPLLSAFSCNLPTQRTASTNRREERGNKEPELMLRSLYGSTHLQGDTVHWPKRLKLAQGVASSLHLTSSLLPTSAHLI